MFVINIITMSSNIKRYLLCTGLTGLVGTQAYLFYKSSFYKTGIKLDFLGSKYESNKWELAQLEQTHRALCTTCPLQHHVYTVVRDRFENIPIIVETAHKNFNADNQYQQLKYRMEHPLLSLIINKPEREIEVEGRFKLEYLHLIHAQCEINNIKRLEDELSDCQSESHKADLRKQLACWQELVINRRVANAQRDYILNHFDQVLPQ